MSLTKDLKVLYHMVLSPIRGTTHKERLESFYDGQADAYDSFRAHLLRGREELYESLPIPDDGVMIEMGGGTGWNLENLGERIQKLKKVYIVDLSPSLLGVAQKRIAERGWDNVETVEADVTTFVPPETDCKSVLPSGSRTDLQSVSGSTDLQSVSGVADVITFSYSLTMIPNWFAAIDHACRLLKPGGIIGVVDFFVSRKYPAEGQRRHWWWTRSFWPVWMALDNVFPQDDHVPYLHHRFEPVQFSEHLTRMRYMPLFRIPYYRFVGRKRTEIRNPNIEIRNNN